MHPYAEVPEDRSTAAQKPWPWSPTKGIPKASEIWGFTVHHLEKTDLVQVSKLLNQKW